MPARPSALRRVARCLLLVVVFALAVPPPALAKDPDHSGFFHMLKSTGHGKTVGQLRAMGYDSKGATKWYELHTRITPRRAIAVTSFVVIVGGIFRALIK